MLNFVHHSIAIGSFKQELQSIQAKIDIFFTSVTLNLTDDLEKQKLGHLFYATSSPWHHSIDISEFTLE